MKKYSVNFLQKMLLKKSAFIYKWRAQGVESISPSFCIAKWKQVTIDLFHGQTHSCHHPIRHDIDEDQLGQNPSALHNTQKKLNARAQMIAGERPEECSYCWEIEDTDKKTKSDRLIKSSEAWAYPFKDEIVRDPQNPKVSPSYLEVMFDNTCNFSCAYCMAGVSSSIEIEMERYGLYPVENDQLHRGNWKKSDSRPNKADKYIKAFWQWFPLIQKELHVFRITGGEPFLSKDTRKVIEYLIENPNEKLTFAINTNLNVGEKLFNSYLERLSCLVNSKSIKLFQLFTSLDSVEEQAEYIRFGLNYKLLISNIRKFASLIPEAEIRIMTTFSILSIPRFYDFVSVIVELRRSGLDIEFDISYLSEPRYLRANIGDEKVIRLFYEQIERIKKDFINENLLKSKEIAKIERTFHWADSTFNRSENLSYRKDFYHFINEYDRRKKRDFAEVFPELVDFKKSLESY